MRYYGNIVSTVLRVAVLCAIGVVTTRASTAPAAPLELRVMTYNLRYASPAPPNSWPERRPVMTALLQREGPDVFGTQEGLYGQLRELAADLPEYDWVGLGRAGGSKDEFCAIFYKHERFEPVEYDHFWLSDTPEVVGSMTWGNKYRRMVTWLRLRDRSTGREFEVWNTHFDHQVEEARRKSAALIRDRLAAADQGVPLVLTGDFNCPAGDSVAFDILTEGAGLTDTWSAAPERRNEGLDTYNDFKAPAREGVRIDWILVRGATSVPKAGIVDYDDLPRFPSDHFPVTATVRF